MGQFLSQGNSFKKKQRIYKPEPQNELQETHGAFKTDKNTWLERLLLTVVFLDRTHKKFTFFMWLFLFFIVGNYVNYCLLSPVECRADVFCFVFLNKIRPFKVGEKLTIFFIKVNRYQVVLGKCMTREKKKVITPLNHGINDDDISH